MTTYLLAEKEIRARNYKCHSTDLLIIGELTWSVLRTTCLLTCDRGILGAVYPSISRKATQLNWTFLLTRAQIGSPRRDHVMVWVSTRDNVGPQLFVIPEYLTDLFSTSCSCSNPELCNGQIPCRGRSFIFSLHRVLVARYQWWRLYMNCR